MSRAIRFAGLTDPGVVRSENQDAWTADPEQGLFIVSDGMAGVLEGGLAAQIVVKTLPPILKQRMKGIEDLAAAEAEERLLGALSELSDHVRQETQGQLGLEGTGATVILLILRGLQALIGQMGDSRVYLLRDGQFKRLTKDHSIVQLLIDSGDITPEGALTHPARGQLTRYVGMDGEPLPETRLLELRQGDRLLLCSDGLTGMLSDEELATICSAEAEPEDTCKRLIDAGNEAGGEDNMTALIVDVSGG